MPYLNNLVSQFESTNGSEINLRIMLVLEMIEYTITYPPPEYIEPCELVEVNRCVHELVKELTDNCEPLLAKRIHKTWRKRRRLLQIAERACSLKQDYMDNLLYHEEVTWLRKMIVELSDGDVTSFY